MATASLSTSPTQIDAGSSDNVSVTNTGSVDVVVARGAQSYTLRPTQARVVYPEGVAVTAAAVSGSGSVSYTATAARLSQQAQFAADPAFTGTYGLIAQSYTASIPSGLSWPAAFPLGTVTISDGPGGRPTASVGLTPEAAFDSVSTARSAPGATYYVNVSTGVNTNNGLTSGTAVKGIWKAVDLANAGGVPATIFVASGTYARTDDPTGAGGSWPTVDLAFIATGGRVNTGSFDLPGTPSLDGTQTNCYSWAVANAERVVDTTNLTREGHYTDLVNVASPAICNATPNSWVISAGTLYVHRGDGAAVVNANTRVFRTASWCWRFQNDVNAYIGGQTGYDTWDCEGGSSFGVLDAVRASAGSTNRVIAARNCTFRYAGGGTNTAARCVAVDSFKGLVYLYGCDASAAQTDGFNAHNSGGASGTYLLTVNCSGIRNGRAGGSCNGWTTHEDVIGADIAGYYARNSGGTVRSINSSKSWLVGTTVVDDFGDLWQGGTSRPIGIRVDNTAIYWCDRTKVTMANGGFAYVAGDTGAIHRRNCQPTGLPDYVIPAATLDTY